MCGESRSKTTYRGILPEIPGQIGNRYLSKPFPVCRWYYRPVMWHGKYRYGILPKRLRYLPVRYRPIPVGKVLTFLYVSGIPSRTGTRYVRYLPRRYFYRHVPFDTFFLFGRIPEGISIVYQVVFSVISHRFVSSPITRRSAVLPGITSWYFYRSSQSIRHLIWNSVTSWPSLRMNGNCESDASFFPFLQFHCVISDVKHPLTFSFGRRDGDGKCKILIRTQKSFDHGNDPRIFSHLPKWNLDSGRCSSDFIFFSLEKCAKSSRRTGASIPNVVHRIYRGVNGTWAGLVLGFPLWKGLIALIWKKGKKTWEGNCMSKEGRSIKYGQVSKINRDQITKTLTIITYWKRLLCLASILFVRQSCWPENLQVIPRLAGQIPYR